MSVFGKYSQYYNLLYRDKDYVKEADCVHTLLQRYAPQAQSLLELGCGTGRHAALLAQKGYVVHGIDRSAEMLTAARQSKTELLPEVAARLSFAEGDIRQYSFPKSFDAIISLFHVVSYQTTNQDLRALFATAGKHLRPGGILLFDCWYGPAVLTDRPVVRIKRIEDEQLQVTRLAEPTCYPNENCIDVNYHVFIRDKQTNQVEELHETHTMRYLFCPEIDRLLEEQGLERRMMEEWMTGRTPDYTTWGVCFVAQKRL